jgi:hypothetical protein
MAEHPMSEDELRRKIDFTRIPASWGLEPEPTTPPGTIPPGTIRGLGTKEDPELPPVKYRQNGMILAFNPRLPVCQCGITACGRWFQPAAPGQARCHTCIRQSRASEEGGTGPSTPGEMLDLEVQAGERWADFRKRIRTMGVASIPPDADIRKARNFGVYGDIVCTWREMTAARLVADGNAVIDIADVVGIPPSHVFAMQDGVGQPRFQDMVAHYHAVDIGLQMLHNERSLRRKLNNAEGLTPKQSIEAEIQLSKLHTEVSERLPKPPKAREINFGDDIETQGIRQIARGLAVDFTLLRPGNPETGEMGGPGPRT